MNRELHWVALGDSTGVGVGGRRGGYVERAAERLRSRGHAVRVHNLCQSGATSEDVKRAARRLPSGCDLITLAVGVNDIRWGVGPEQFAANVKEVLDVAAARARLPVIVTNLPDASLAPVVPRYARDAVASAIESYNAELARIVDDHGAHLVDLHSESRAVLLSREDLFCADGFHPSDAGYEVWAEILLRALDERLAA